MERAEAEAALADASSRLIEVVEVELPRWLERQVVRVTEAQGREVDGELMARCQEAGQRAVDDVMTHLRSLLATDPDEQTRTPLEIIRGAVVHATGVLAQAGIGPTVRDRFQEERFPDDPYDLTPAGFADLGEDAHEAGLRWGVARAAVHRARHEP